MCVIQNAKFRHSLLFQNYVYQTSALEEADSIEKEPFCQISCLDTGMELPSLGQNPTVYNRKSQYYSSVVSVYLNIWFCGLLTSFF